MKKLCIVIITIILLILLLSCPITKSEKYITQNKMIDSYNIILKKIKNNEKINIVKNRKIIDYSNKIISDNQIIGTGKFIKLKSNIIYGFLNYDGYCLKKEYNNNLNFIKGTCKDIELPERAYKKIEENTASTIFKEDIYSSKNKEFNSRKYFTGKNPNNFIIYSKACWRIVNITNNNSLKIIYEGPSENGQCLGVNTNVSGSIGLFTWDIDKNKVGNWEEQSYLRERIDYWDEYNIVDVYPLKIELDKKYIVGAYWNIGSISDKNSSLLEDVNDEEKIVTRNKHHLGLLNVSDYLKVNCESSSNFSTSLCGKDNYLYKNKYNWWTINSVDNNQKNVWVIMQDGTVKNTPVKLSNEYFFSGTRIVAYLKDEIIVIGKGTEMTPYIIVQ